MSDVSKLAKKTIETDKHTTTVRKFETVENIKNNLNIMKTRNNENMEDIGTDGKIRHLWLI